MRAIRRFVIAAMLLFVGIKGFAGNLNAYHAEEELSTKLADAVITENTPVSVPEKAEEAEEEVLGVSRVNELPSEIAAMAVDFEELSAINSDVVAWIYIPAVDISYPVVKGSDNEEYLHKSFDGKKNSAGAVFMNYANSEDFSDENTFVFAHNMKNGSMFGSLKSFVWDTETVNSNPYIWIFTPNATYQYEIFSAYNTDKNSDMYQISSDHDGYVESALSQSVIFHDCDTEGRLLTLSTCAGFAGSGNRLLVHGSLIEEY